MTHTNRHSGIITRALVLLTGATLMALTTIPANCDGVLYHAEPDPIDTVFDHAKCNGGSNTCKDVDCADVLTFKFDLTGKATVSPFGVGIEVSGTAGASSAISSHFESNHYQFVQCKTSTSYCKSNTCRSFSYMCGQTKLFLGSHCPFLLQVDTPYGYANGCKVNPPG